MYQQPYQPVPPPPARKSSTGKVIGIVAGVIIALLCCCGVGVFVAVKSDFAKGFMDGFSDALTSDPNNATVGDCLNDGNAQDMKIVECGAPEAVFVVVGVVSNKSEDEVQQECSEFEESGDYLFLYEGRYSDSIKGTGLCLAPNA